MSILDKADIDFLFMQKVLQSFYCLLLAGYSPPLHFVHYDKWHLCFSPFVTFWPQTLLCRFLAPQDGLEAPLVARGLSRLRVHTAHAWWNVIVQVPSEIYYDVFIWFVGLHITVISDTPLVQYRRLQRLSVGELAHHCPSCRGNTILPDLDWCSTENRSAC